tara:strand:+ start:8250 stop:9095 length:846 start_codon:yes stop_codon:yes gene_type:complete
MPTKKQLIDDVLILHERFSRSDDSRVDETWVGYKVEQARVSEILKEYNVTKVIDQNWLVDFGIHSLTKVNFSDDPIVDFCACDIMKAEIPEVINLTYLGDGNLDLGLRVISACGKTTYTAYPIEAWRMIPKEHVRSMFHYYQRFGTTIYVNKLINNLRFFGIPATTEGLMIKKTLPVISGGIKSGYSYTVKGTTGLVVYDGVNYLPNDTFTGTATTTFTASGSSQVFYTNYEVEMTENDPYPVSAHLARQIVISILTTEFQIEKQQVVDVLNDSADDVVTK